MTDHPCYKLGRRPPEQRPALMFADIRTGAIPEHPAAADHLGAIEFGLYQNDRYGDCGPTMCANYVRLVSTALLGEMVAPSQTDVFDLYRRSGNPNFDPKTGADDNGVVLQTMLDTWLKEGMGDGHGGIVKPVAFAKVDVTSDDELEAAVSIFGGCLWGVDLEVAQQSQTDANPPVWDYRRSGEWGGHAILDGKYEQDRQTVVSWAMRIATTDAFRRRQLEEAWVVVLPWHLDYPGFQLGVDLDALASAYRALTGRTLPVPVTPPPPPPAADPDRVFFDATAEWAAARHTGANRRAAQARNAWAAAKGFM